MNQPSEPITLLSKIWQTINETIIFYPVCMSCTCKCVNIHVKSLPTIIPKSFNKHNYNQHKNYTHIYKEL